MDINEVLEGFFEDVEVKKSLPEKELKEAYNKSENMTRYTGNRSDLIHLGLIFEPFQDVNIYQDKDGNYWADYFYIGD